MKSVELAIQVLHEQEVSRDAVETAGSGLKHVHCVGHVLALPFN